MRQAHLDVNAVRCLADRRRARVPSRRGARPRRRAYVELGAAVTTVSLYAGGMLIEMASLPFGASDITDDIASAFGIRRSRGAATQSFYGSALGVPARQ